MEVFKIKCILVLLLELLYLHKMNIFCSKHACSRAQIASAQHLVWVVHFNAFSFILVNNCIAMYTVLLPIMDKSSSIDGVKGIMK